MHGSRVIAPSKTTPKRALQPLPAARSSVGYTSGGAKPPATVGGSGSGSPSGEALPPSRIPIAFHVYQGRRCLFPTERPAGDAETLHLANALSGMLEQWRAKLEESKPSFPMGSSGSTLWGVLQMIVYDIWSTIEESRIWDTAFLEAQREVHFYSPQLSAMLGRVRSRIAQSFESILSMSQRLQYELQRWHSQWVHAGESYQRESSLRHGLQLQAEQLQAKLLQMENDGRIATAVASRLQTPLASSSSPLGGGGSDGGFGGVGAGGVGAGGGRGDEYEATLRKLQHEVTALRKQLRTAQATATALRGREVELRLTNEGLVEEVLRWKDQLKEARGDAGGSEIRRAFESMGGSQQAELLQALQTARAAAHPELTTPEATAAAAAAAAAAKHAPAPSAAAAFGVAGATSEVAQERLQALSQLVDSLTADEEAAIRAQLDANAQRRQQRLDTMQPR